MANPRLVKVLVLVVTRIIRSTPTGNFSLVRVIGLLYVIVIVVSEYTS